MACSQQDRTLCTEIRQYVDTLEKGQQNRKTYSQERNKNAAKKRADQRPSNKIISYF